jgi:hypothetical protein
MGTGRWNGKASLAFSRESAIGRSVMDSEASGTPDFTAGVPQGDISDGGTLLGLVGDEAVVLARSGEEIFAVGAECTHYHGPLTEGLVVGDTIRCPWHHACSACEAARRFGRLPFCPCRAGGSC